VVEHPLQYLQISIDLLKFELNMLMLIWDDERIQKYMKNITYRNKEGMERLKQGQKVHCN
jgi:hypothetical protein